MGFKNMYSSMLKGKLRKLEFEGIETRWINSEAMLRIISSWKWCFKSKNIEINAINNPVLIVNITQEGINLIIENQKDPCFLYSTRASTY